MATKFQHKRTSVSGRTPNTSDPANTSYIAAGEFAVNLTDERVYSSNGTIAFEVGANLTNLSVTTVFTLGNSTVNTTINSTSISAKTITANGGVGTDGQVLTSNGSAIYWSTSSGGSSSLTTYTYSITSNTTVIEGADDNAAVLSYSPNKELVYLNGVKLALTDDYAQTNTSAITLQANAVSGDVVQVISFSNTVLLTTYTYSVTSNTTVIEGADDAAAVLSYTAGGELVFLNGLKLAVTDDYAQTNTSAITLQANAVNGDTVQIVTIAGSPFVNDLIATTEYASGDTNILNIDTFSAGSFRTAKYLVQANSADSFHSSEAVVIHDGSTAYVAEYGIVYSNNSLYTLSADINTGNVRLRATPAVSGTTFKTKRIILEV